MKDDRDQVLARVRASLKTAYLPSSRATIPPQSVNHHADRAQMIESFRRELEPLGGVTWLARAEQEAIEIVLRLLRGEDAREILAWAESDLCVRGLSSAICDAGVMILDGRVPDEPAARKTKLKELERATVGVTGALAGLADTGTLALLTAPTRPRLASLLPPVHIALLPISQLYPNLPAFFAAHPAIADEGSNLVFITGPSRTADIELTLTRGVHGPRQVHVVLVNTK